MAKIQTAKEILEKKGYVENKFDTEGFMKIVNEWFLSHNLNAKLSIFSARFIDIENSPSSGYDDTWLYTDDEILASKGREALEQRKNKKYPYKYKSIRNVREKIVGVEGVPLGLTDFKVYRKVMREINADPNAIKKYTFERSYEEKEEYVGIFVDEPFIKNAVFALKVLAGYVVIRQKKGEYTVTLL